MLTSGVDYPGNRCTEGRHWESFRVEVLTSVMTIPKELKILAIEVLDLEIQAEEGKDEKTGGTDKSSRLYLGILEVVGKNKKLKMMRDCGHK